MGKMLRLSPLLYLPHHLELALSWPPSLCSPQCSKNANQVPSLSYRKAGLSVINICLPVAAPRQGATPFPSKWRGIHFCAPRLLGHIQNRGILFAFLSSLSSLLMLQQIPPSLSLPFSFFFLPFLPWVQLRLPSVLTSSDSPSFLTCSVNCNQCPCCDFTSELGTVFVIEVTFGCRLGYCW